MLIGLSSRLSFIRIKLFRPMKSIQLFFFAFFFSATVFGQMSTLTVTFKFAAITEGYDHICKSQVWMNGELLGESKEVQESAGGSFTVDIPYGEHTIRVINLANYEGDWEEHTIENNYSIDCEWRGSYVYNKKKNKLFLLHDLDSGTVVSWKKMPKPAK